MSSDNPFIQHNGQLTGKAKVLLAGGVGLLVLGFCATFFYKSVPAGHVAVGTFFGKIQPEEKPSGFHVVNPLVRWTEYDVREKTHKEEASVPSQDQLTTDIDVSVQYNIIGDQAARILGETGNAEDAVQVHLIPKLRSLMREQGKTVERAEEFFRPETQERLTRDIEAQLKAYLEPKGINVQAVLLRDFRLPPSILANVELKKQAEQKVEQEKAELEQVKVQAQQRVEQAKAEREAAQEQAEQKKVLADAQAYEIQKINEAIAQNPAYIQLEALKALQAMSKDEAAKLYFMNSDSPMPLPLMNLGEPLGTANSQ